MEDLQDDPEAVPVGGRLPTDQRVVRQDVDQQVVRQGVVATVLPVQVGDGWGAARLQADCYRRLRLQSSSRSAQRASERDWELTKQ